MAMSDRDRITESFAGIITLAVIIGGLALLLALFIRTT
jgi:hypothetical protein